MSEQNVDQRITELQKYIDEENGAIFKQLNVLNSLLTAMRTNPTPLHGLSSEQENQLVTRIMKKLEPRFHFLPRIAWTTLTLSVLSLVMVILH